MIPEAVSQPFGKRPVHKHPLSVALLPLVLAGAFALLRNGKFKLYSPAVPKEAVAGEQTDALLREMYGGSASLMVSHLVERGQVTDKEIEEMIAILKRAKP